jgi:Ca2+-binding EF-hand superfamily protein
MQRRHHGNAEERVDMICLITAIICALVAIVRPLAAQSPPNTATPAEAAKFLAFRIGTNVTLDRYLQTLGSDFHRADANGDGVVSTADIALHVAVQSAISRTMYASEVMAADLDGDGVVSEAELRQKLSYDERMSHITAALTPSQPEKPLDEEAERRIEQRVARMMPADADKDGRITWNEAIAYFGATPDHRQIMTFGQEMVSVLLLALAPPGKESVTLGDVEAAGEALFREIDETTTGRSHLRSWRPGAQSNPAERALRDRAPVSLSVQARLGSRSAKL